MTADSSSVAAANSLWGGRFAEGPSAIMTEINASIGFDQRMWREDIAGSKAHASMLAACDIISQADHDAIQAGLDQIHSDIEAGRFVFKTALEDIHMNIEARLADLIGPAAGRLHTARSRNDQVATDFRLWLRRHIDEVGVGISGLLEALITQAERHAATILPGLTHLQAAQPVTLGHHLLAYVEMIHRDAGRFADCRTRLNESPLGAAALAGTVYPIDRHMSAAALGFAAPCENSLDAVSSRDFALEYLAAAAILSIHLSRLAEEIVLWASDRFRFITLSDAYSTGSSIMPQKRNPDAAELVRAKPGRIVGALNGLLLTLKGLPLAYSKDMQEDKEPVFLAADTLGLCLAAMTGMIADLRPRPEVMRAAAEGGFLTATDLADWLVLELGMPFREAHHVTGRAVRRAEELGVRLPDLSLAELQAIEPHITADVYSVLTVEASAARRTSYGGTAPDQVRAAAARARARLG